MNHTANTLLLLATWVGCGTSNAFVAGIPVAGEAATTASSSLSTGPLQAPSSLLRSAGSAGSVGSSLMPPLIPASAGAGAASVLPNATAGAFGSPAPAATGDACRQVKYSLAVRLTIDMSWEETPALMAESAKLYTWSKLTIDPTAGVVSEFRACGSLPPVFHGTALAGNFQGFQRVPLAAYDLETMPSVAGGSATRAESVLTLMPAPLVGGLRLSDPAGPWPASSSDPNLMPVDADADGKPGITSQMRDDAPFAGAPTSILQTERLDATYNANRLAFRLTLQDAACSAALEGTAELLAIDSLVLGCHVKDRGDCRPEELSFYVENGPRIKFGATAPAQAVVIPSEATCTQAVKVLEVATP